MPPKKVPPPAFTTIPAKQKRFKPPFRASPPVPPPPSSAGESQPSQSQGGDEDIATLGQILESMMKVSNDRRARRRKDIENAYKDGFTKVEGRAWAWVDGLRAREKHRQLATLTRLKALLVRKKAIENEILATVETMVEACENFGTMIQSDDSTGLDENEN